MPINKPSQPLVPAEIDPAVLDGKADLVNGEVPSDQLPSYVDDVLEFADASEFPAEGETGKIYVALDTNYTYRWSGAAYVQVGGSSLGAGNGIEIENDLVSVDEEYLNEHLEFEAPINDLDTIRSGATAGATAVQPADVADDMEVVAYQTQTPLSAEQLAKAEAGKLAIYKDNLVYTKFYQDGNVVSFQALEHMSENGTYTPAYNVRIRRYTLTLDRSTRILNDAGYQQGVSVADTSDNFLPTGTAPAVDGKRIIREANLAEGLGAKQNTLVSGTNIKTLNSQSLLGSGNINIQSTPMVNTTYAELKALRDGSNLIPGMQYRITDYDFTIDYGKRQSAHHQFDLIVTAETINTLQTTCKACLHEGDTYFSQSSDDLSQWQIWYSLDNDRTKYGWADETNGKGVIFRMIDSFDNDAPIDFKNYLQETSNYDTQGTRYLFGKDTADKSITGIMRHNVMRSYYEASGQTVTYLAPHRCFISGSDNFIDYRCSNIDIFGSGNHVGRYSYNIALGKKGYSESDNNYVGASCQQITLGYGCSGNTFETYCSIIALGDSCRYNIFADSCYNLHIGQSCGGMQFGIDCQNIYLGAYYTGIHFGNGVSAVCFGSSQSSLINYVQDVHIGDRCERLYIISDDTEASSSNYLKNVVIHDEIQGPGSAYLTISVADRNLPYLTEYKLSGSTEILL